MNRRIGWVGPHPVRQSRDLDWGGQGTDKFCLGAEPGGALPRQHGPGRWLTWGGMLGMPCLESSARTQSMEGGLSPRGKGNHGLLIASFTMLSITSSSCNTKTSQSFAPLKGKFNCPFCPEMSDNFYMTSDGSRL